MSGNNLIKDIDIQKRINNSTSTFTITFNTPLAPDEFDTGMPFEFILNDNTVSEGYTVFRGVIEEVNRDEQDGNRIYSIVGRDVGRLLSRQPFVLDCSSTSKKNTYNTILLKILEDTDVSIGKGLTAITGSV